MAEHSLFRSGDGNVTITSSNSEKRSSLSFSITPKQQFVAKKSSNSLSMQSRAPPFSRQANVNVDEDPQSQSSVDEKNKAVKLRNGNGTRQTAIMGGPLAPYHHRHSANTILTQFTDPGSQLQMNPMSSLRAAAEASSSKINASLGLKKPSAVGNNSLSNNSAFSSIHENEPLFVGGEGLFQQQQQNNNTLVTPSLGAMDSLSRKSSFNSVR
jgi:hypothetical protein